MTTGSHTDRQTGNLRILIAPLDWGLGHATRCIPIIQTLHNKGFEVFLAAEGAIASLLAEEFPSLRLLSLPGYRIRYTRNRRFLLFRLLSLLPGAIATYMKSSRLIKKWVKEYDISVVISDNRPELHHCGTRSIYITHQLEVRTGISWFNRLSSLVHRYCINKFDHCWVPDEEGEKNLGGSLSHPKLMPRIPVSYIGCITRFQKEQYKPEEYDLLFILSGPEPQRSILEEKLIEQWKEKKSRIALVRGLPGQREIPSTHTGIRIFNHLPAKELNKLIQSSAMIIARCGYSTVMDLALLGKKALLIPTPGQGEQEYLADYLEEKKFFHTVSQDKLKEDDVKKAEKHQYSLPPWEGIKEEVILKTVRGQIITQ